MDESRSNGAALVRSHASSTDAVSLDALVAERRRNVLDTARQLEAQLGKTADHVSARFDAARSTVASSGALVRRYRWWAVGGAVALGVLLSRRRQIVAPRAPVSPLRPLWSAALTTFASIAAKEIASRVMRGPAAGEPKE